MQDLFKTKAEPKVQRECKYYSALNILNHLETLDWYNPPNEDYMEEAKEELKHIYVSAKDSEYKDLISKFLAEQITYLNQF